MVENNNIEVGGRLHSIATGNVVTGADEILYEPIGGIPKKQSEVNVETYEHVANIDAALQELSPDQTEALALATDVNDLKDNVVRSDAQTLTDVQKAQALANVGINGIDNEPTAGSDNLVKSSGVQNELALGAVYDISAKNPTAGPNNDGKFESLSSLLSDANLNTLIPSSVRKGGISIKFIQSSDNKYVQYRLISDEFTTNIAQWQGVDEEIVSGSKNLVEGNAVFAELYNTNFNDLELTNNRGGYVDKTSGGIGSPDSTSWRLYYFPCSRGDKFKVKYTSWNSTTAVVYSIFNDITIEDSSIALVKGPLGESDIEYDVVIADSNAKWFVVQERISTTTQRFQFGCSVKKAINTNKFIQQMFNSKDWTVDGNVVYDSNEIPASCDIRWADGTLGTLVYSDFNDNIFEYTTLTATYNTQTIVYSLTFDENGYITNETINIQ